jgi:hypothetical protein
LSHSIPNNDPTDNQFQAPSPVDLKRLGMSLEQNDVALSSLPACVSRHGLGAFTECRMPSAEQP